MVRKGLGKGLGAIFGEDVIKESEEGIAKAKAAATEKEDGKSGELMVKMTLIKPSREQPRKNSNEEQLAELADSIGQYGILQPLLVQKKGTFYEIITGERKWRAAKIAGLREVPVVLREYDKWESMEVALIEDVQRADLSPIEEVLAYQRLVTEFKLTQEEIAVRVSKNRATITNSMHLLRLDRQIQEILIQNLVSSGHARALLSLENKGFRLKTAKVMLDELLSVRKTECLVKCPTKEVETREEKKDKSRDEALALIYQNLEGHMKSVTGTKVNIHDKDKNKGRTEIEYYSEAELQRAVEMIESIRQVQRRDGYYMENSTLNQIPFDPAYIMARLLILVVLLLILTITAVTKVRRSDRQYGYFMRREDAETLEDVIPDQIEEIRDLKVEGGSSKDSIRTLNRNRRASFQKYGFVKYNAFKGTGGNLSFIFAMLDYINSGFVLNCVHSRKGCYPYIRVVDMGQTNTVLGDEEQEALEQALGYIKKS